MINIFAVVCSCAVVECQEVVAKWLLIRMYSTDMCPIQIYINPVGTTLPQYLYTDAGLGDLDSLSLIPEGPVAVEVFRV